jgi:hypothetical protein
MVSEVESFVLSQAQAVPDGVRLGLAGGLGITFLTDVGNPFMLAIFGPS